MPAEEGLDKEVNLLDADKYYEGTKWEFEVFPELKEHYIPKDQKKNNGQLA